MNNVRKRLFSDVILGLVEHSGFEPLTSTMRIERSASSGLLRSGSAEISFYKTIWFSVPQPPRRINPSNPSMMCKLWSELWSASTRPAGAAGGRFVPQRAREKSGMENPPSGRTAGNNGLFDWPFFALPYSRPEIVGQGDSSPRPTRFGSNAVPPRRRCA